MSNQQWSKIPYAFIDMVKKKVGDDGWISLENLADKYHLLDQTFFRDRKRLHYANNNLAVEFSLFLNDMCNCIAQTGSTEDAEALFRISIILNPSQLKPFIEEIENAKDLAEKKSIDKTATVSDDDQITQAVKACLCDISEESKVDYATFSEAESALEIFIFYSFAIKHVFWVHDHYHAAHKFMVLLMEKLTDLLSNSRDQIQALVNNRFTIYVAAFETHDNIDERVENALMVLQTVVPKLKNDSAELDNIRNYFKAVLKRAEHIAAKAISPNANFESRQIKEDLIRTLLKKRIIESGTIDDPEDFKQWVDTLTTELLWGVPEAMIVTIVETYFLFKADGWNHYEILSWIEEHRSKLIVGKSEIKAKHWDSEEDLKVLEDSDWQFGKGNPTIPKTLVGYIKYRTALEDDDQHGVPISEKTIEETIEVALRFFS